MHSSKRTIISSSNVQLEGLKRRIHGRAARARRHASTALFGNQRVCTVPAQPADTRAAGESVLEQAESPTRSAVDLHLTSAVVHVAGTVVRGREHGRRGGVDRGRVHDVELRTRSGRVVVLVGEIAAEAAVH